MIKKGFIVGIVMVGIVFVFVVFIEKWSYFYFVLGIMGVVLLVLVLVYFIDSIVLGSIGIFFLFKKMCKVS